MNIVCLSTQNWDDPMWTNKQHIMSRLSREHRVIYVDKGVLGLRYFIYKKDDESGFRLTLKYLFNAFEERNKNLTILTEKITPPNPYWLKMQLLKRYLKKKKINDAILWIYQPEYEKYIGTLDEKLVVYDCVDEYSAFPAYSSPHKKKNIIETEKRLLKKADLVITSAPDLYERKKKFNKNTHLVHNVGNTELFMKAMDKDLEIPDDIKNIKKPVIGFVGAVDRYKVDFELLQKMAEKHPEWSIVLIGPSGSADFSTKTSSLKKIKNIHFLGTKDYTTLPNYIKAFDVCTIPYNINEYTKSCFPIKFFEFCASGKPVVITALPALKDYSSIVKYARSNEAFIRSVEDVLKKDPRESKEKRLKIAKENSWDSRINRIMDLIQQRLKEKYGNA
ncbi:glycosyltransferase [Candidatus Margulisiibacteriota bacterium]